MIFASGTITWAPQKEKKSSQIVFQKLSSVLLQRTSNKWIKIQVMMQEVKILQEFPWKIFNENQLLLLAIEH